MASEQNSRFVHLTWLTLAALLFGLLGVGGGCVTTDPPLETPTTVCECRNGATCDETGACVCQNDYYGEQCEFLCDCQNGGSCDDGKDGTGTCSCAPNFFGATCDGVCNCPNGQACVDGVDGDGTCLCPDGEPGSSCEMTSSCDCQNGGACDDSGACLCQPGFLGAKCENSCSCQNGAVCDDGAAGTGACTCASDFYGADCSSACACENGGICDDGADGTGACSCPDGFWGANCENACDCGGQPCNDQTGACGECPSGSYGADCSEQCDCQNGALCDDGKSGSGSCTCQDGFYGANCASACNCQNGASCDDGANGTGACTCPADTYGADCSQQCNCQNGAGCDDGASGTGACSCPAGTFGADCSQTCPGGMGNVCSGHGTCDDGADGSGGCMCTGGYSGADCSIAPPCNSPGSSVGDVMIVEVMYDAPNGGAYTEPEAEYVILYNNSCGDISLQGWEICDNSGCLEIQVGTLPQHTATVFIDSTGPAGLGAYGCALTSAHKDSAAAFVGGEWFSNNLANSSDKLELKNPGGTTIDRLSYGSDTSIFNPSVDDSGPGDSIHRTGYPWSGTLPANSGASAWEAAPGGGHICNITSNGTF